MILVGERIYDLDCQRGGLVVEEQGGAGARMRGDSNELLMWLHCVQWVIKTALPPLQDQYTSRSFPETTLPS